MRTADSIPPGVRREQRTVADPDVSAWVAANAGSGKTHVLAQRVINLLLEDIAPEKILCITFTKAAAANMAKRIFDTLGKWTTLDDAGIDQEIAELSGTAPDSAKRALARRLFARALETPGGLKVHTVHAFCTQLLHQFPFEANVAAAFSVLDESEQTHLLERLTLAVLLSGAEKPGSALGVALTTAMTAAADQTFRDVVRGAIAQRNAIDAAVSGAGGLSEAIAAIARTLGVEPDLTLAQVEYEIVNGPILPPSEWQAVATVCNTGSVRDQTQGERLALAATSAGMERIEAYLGIFLDSKSQPRSSLLTKNLVKEYPGLAQRLIDEQQRVVTLYERRNAIICRDRSAALLTVAHEVLRRYEDEKERRGLVDYDDLIDKTLALLRNVDAAWVHYKLDLGIDHLLIDEAQDTSGKQWEIVQRLVAEFTAGAGARTAQRTIFAVGDEKQSIYSFQNAAPKEFGAVGRYFARAHADADLKFVFGRLETSFRSGESLLAAVDTVFKQMAGVTSDKDGFPAHIALPNAPPSLVEIWEPMRPDDRKEIEGWDAPFDRSSETSPRVKLAQRIARTVRRLVDGGQPVGLDRRPVRYGDVLVLVRQRGELFEAIIRALKNQDVAVAGADRLVLTEHIAVMDLMALADALLLPQDDLALATVLRSPLFGFSDEELFAIAWNRGGLSLRAALAKNADANPAFAAAADRLDDLARRAQRDAPFAFYAAILGADGGRQRILARLGHEANDALDEFLNLTFDYERAETPSLQGFVAWLREARTEVKRDMEIARDEVRVMTVHGAKGLEAPVVFLADTMTQPSGPRQPRLLKLGGGSMVWAGRKADDVAAVATARQQALADAADEYRRLLYVAMTRAADRLIICGAEGRIKRPEGCWYDLVRETLGPFLVEEADGEDKVLRYRNTPDSEEAAAPAGAVASEQPKPERPVLPSWLREKAAGQMQRAAPLAPSSAFDEDIGRITHSGASAIERQKALDRGRVVHRLLQSLPDIPPARRGEAMAHYLANAAKDFSFDERLAMMRQIFAVLDAQDFAEVFAPGSRAEVTIVGKIARPGDAPVEIAGQVDRLTVSRDTVLIADYKTDAVVPEGPDDVAPPYVTQLALYRTVLRRLYPGRNVRAALIFTDGPSLIELPSALMESALDAELAKVPAGAAATR